MTELASLATKFLNCIKQPEALAVEALKELKHVGTERAFVFNNPNNAADPRNGHRDFDSIVIHFDKLWSGMYKRGLIRPLMARSSEVPSTRVDGEQFAIEEEEAFSVGEANVPLSSEMRCYNCHGFGHGSRECSSESRRRDIRDAITILQSAQARLGSSSGPSSSRIVSRKSGLGSRTKGMRSQKKVSVYMLEDGTLEDCQGVSYKACTEDSAHMVGEPSLPTNEHSSDLHEGVDEDPPSDEEISYIESRYSHLLEPDVCVVSEDENDYWSDGNGLLVGWQW